MKHEFISQKCEEDNHFLWVHLQKFSLDICGIYKPERTNTNKFLETLTNELQNKKRTILFGDFNFNLLGSDRSTKEYKDTLSENGYKVLNRIDARHCTRETSSTRTILDHVSTNLRGHDFHFVIVESSMSDHKQIFLEVKQYKPEPTKKIQMRTISFAKLYKTIEDIDYATVGEDFTKLEEAIKLAISKNQTTKIKFLNPPKTEWITKDIIDKINARNLLWKQHKTNPNNLEFEEKFKSERNRVFSHMQTVKNKYFIKSFEECKDKPLKMWKLINNLSNNKMKDSTIPPKLQTSSGLITEDKEICEHFNTYFASIGILLANKIAPKHHNTNINTTSLHTNAPGLSQMSPTNVEEIAKIIDSLKANTSAGVDGITVKAIKHIKKLILPHLVQCMNKCLLEGYFPDTLKIARVTPIFKSGSKSDPGNYRPISVLPVMSKILEKLVHSRLMDYLDSFGFLYERQYGFRPKSNALAAATDLVTKLRIKIDQKQIALGVFIDLKKAFDTVSHNILLQKLASIKITGSFLRMFESYLENRLQVVKIGNNISSSKLIKCGVPQGSILGPLLFLIYINNVHKLGLKGHITLYADDTCLFYYGNSIEEITQDAQDDLVILERWFLDNLLTINTSKTNYIIFSAKNKKIHNHKPLLIHGDALNKVNTEKYLGLTLDSHLTWQPHIKRICSKLSCLTGALRGMVRCLPSKIRYTVYNSLIKPHIEYLIEVWGSTTKTNIHKSP